MRTSYEIIKSILRTEKSSNVLEPNRQYVFAVASSANKIQIRQAVEEIYKVKVASVNSFILPGKRKRVRQEFGHTKDWKKAVVTLREGNKIETT